jgi:hypothetical protein
MMHDHKYSTYFNILKLFTKLFLSRPVQDPGEARWWGPDRRRTRAAGAGGGSATLSCKAEAGEARGGTRWKRERGKPMAHGPAWGKENMGQTQRNSKFFDLFKKISNEYELF